MLLTFKLYLRCSDIDECLARLLRSAYWLTLIWEVAYTSTPHQGADGIVVARLHVSATHTLA